MSTFIHDQLRLHEAIVSPMSTSSSSQNYCNRQPLLQHVAHTNNLLSSNSNVNSRINNINNTRLNRRAREDVIYNIPNTNNTNQTSIQYNNKSVNKFNTTASCSSSESATYDSVFTPVAVPRNITTSTLNRHHYKNRGYQQNNQQNFEFPVKFNKGMSRSRTSGSILSHVNEDQADMNLYSATKF